MDQNLKNLTAPIGKVTKQYHTTIAIVVVSLLIALSVFRLYQVVMISSEKGVDGYAPTPKASSTFDQKTIDRVDNLRMATENETPLEFPARQSPFVE